MMGEELSIFAVTDGEHFVLLPAAQDHKRLLEGDQGPNTGGMGAYAPVAIATNAVLRFTGDHIVTPTLAEMRRRGTPFSGLLYVGLMLTENGPKVVEFNCRFGDPETQVVLPLLTSSLLELMVGASIEGGLRGARQPTVIDGAAVTTVIASPGYPETPITGAPVVLPPVSTGTLVFHAGTKRRDDGALVTSGGRVFAVTAVAASFEEAQRLSLSGADMIQFPDKVLRRDIGWRERARRAGAS
jgi:phosphoribosylamine--glycine ligase